VSDEFKHMGGHVGEIPSSSAVNLSSPFVLTGYRELGFNCHFGFAFRTCESERVNDTG